VDGGRVVRTATVVVTDLVDSTAMFLGLPPDRADDLRRRFEVVLGDAVVTHGGQVLKNLGDGVLARFSAAGPAVEAAVAMQQGLVELAGDVDLDLRMRIGVATGDVTWESGDVFGRPVVEAARLCGAAEPGGILVAQVAAAAAGEPALLGDPASFELKGLDGPTVARPARWEPAMPTVVPLPAALAAHGPGPVGRDPEVGLLLDHVARAAAGAGVVAAVEGPPGIGKTTLLAEVARRAHADGALVLHGRCDEGTLAVLRPAVDALGPVAARLRPDELRTAAGPSAPDLARVLPEVRRRLPDLPPAARTDPGSERHEVLAAVAAFLSRLGRRRPVLLLLDDLQWADDATAQLVHHLVGAAPPGVALVVAHRSAHGGGALDVALADFARRGGERVVLGGLGAAAVEQLIARAATAPARAEDLLARTGGNPFELLEVLAAGDRADVPSRVADVLGARIRREAEATQRLLDVLAVAVGDAPVDLVAEVLGVDVDGPDGVLVAVDAGVRAGLVVESDGGGQCRCAHDLVRETAYALLGPTRRARLHAAVGRALVRREPDGAEPADTARHLDAARSSDPVLAAEAAAAWARAAARAQSRLGYEAARDASRRGLAALADARNGDDALEVLLRRLLAEAHRALGDYAAARAAGRESATLAARRGLLGARAEALVLLTRLEDAGRADPFLGPSIDEVLDRREDLDDLTRARFLAGAARYLAWSEGRHVEAGLLAAEALAVAGRLPDVDTQREALWASFVASEGSPDAEDRARTGDRLLRLADEHADDGCRIVGHFARALARLELGEREAFDADVDAYEALARRHSGRFELGNARALRILQLQLDARWDDVDTAVNELLGDLVDHQSMTLAVAVLVHLRREGGRLDEVAPGLELSRQVNPAFTPSLALQAMVRAELGDHQGTEAALAALTPDEAAGVGYTIARPVMLAWLTEAAVLGGDEVAARELEHALRPYRGLVVALGNALCLGAADRYLGMLQLLTGRTAEAVASLEAAVAVERRLRAPAHLARSSAWLADALARSPAPADRARARQVLDEAASLAGAHDLVAVGRRLDELHAGLA
jgi:class 3 adenylate cyclase